MRISILIIAVSLVSLACDSKKKLAIVADKDIISFAEARDFIVNYDKSWSDRDTSMLKQQMDSLYNYFSSAGGIIGSREIMQWFSPADKYKVEKAVRSEINIQLSGSIAVVSSRWIGHGSFSGKPFNDDQRCGLVLQKRTGKIHIISEHCIQIENP